MATRRPQTPRRSRLAPCTATRAQLLATRPRHCLHLLHYRWRRDVGCRRVARSSYLVQLLVRSPWPRGHFTVYACCIKGGNATSAADVSLVARTSYSYSRAVTGHAATRLPSPVTLQMATRRRLPPRRSELVVRTATRAQLLATRPRHCLRLLHYRWRRDVGCRRVARSSCLVQLRGCSDWPRGRVTAYTCYITGCRAASVAAAPLGARSSYRYSRALTGHASVSLPTPVTLQVATRRRLPPRRSWLVPCTAIRAQLLARWPRHCLHLLDYRWRRDVGCSRVACSF